MNLTRSRSHGRVAVLATAAALAISCLAGPAHAHHGYAGPVRLYLETVRLEAQGQHWHIRAGVNDSGSGKPAPGFVVEASGSGPQEATFGPVHLSDLDGDGRYEADLGPLPPGDWSVTVSVTDAPGSEERAIPVTRTSTVSLQPGQALDVIGRRRPPRAGAGSDSGMAGPLAYGAAAVIAVLGLVGLWRARRPQARASASSSSTVHWS